MLDKMSSMCTCVLLKRNIINESKTSIFIYGFEFFFSTVLSLISMLLISIAFQMTKEGIIFILFFMPIRMSAGGYHASSFGRCFILTNTIFILYLLLCKLIVPVLNIYLCIIITAVTLIYICINAPIVNINHPITLKRQHINHIRTRQIAAAELIIILLLYIINAESLIRAAMISTIYVAIMMTIAEGGER